MKKIYSTLVALFAIVQFSYAQWFGAPNDIYYKTGKVSIGTTSSFSDLTIQQIATNFNGIVLQAANNDRWLRLGTDGTVGVVEATYNSTTGSMPLVFKSGEAERMRITTGGSVGIGITNPLQKLVTTGVILNAGLTGSNNGIAYTSFTDGIYSSFNSTTPTEGVGMWSDNQGNASIGALYDNPSSSLNLTVRSSSTANGLVAMKILGNGYVGIGTTTPRELLSVNGNIRSKQVKVELANWPDYVFKPTYDLPDLKDIENYIDKNQHLPDMPSEAEVTKDGLNLGEINKQLVKKVEELTLYLIEQNKNAKAQQDQINELKQQMAALTKTLTKH